MTSTQHPNIKRVVVVVQENHTTDNYFRSLAPWGANVATEWPTQVNPPVKDQPHDRRAYGAWLKGAGTATRTQFDTYAVLPYYAHLALSGAFLENHCSGFGTNSTPNHLLLVGGQTPTLRNPPGAQPPPLWDMPSLPGHAGDHGISWRCYTADHAYPAGFYTQLHGSPNLVTSSQFVTDAKAGSLPSLCYLWHNSPYDEHPPADVTVGMRAVQEAVDAVAAGGSWDETVFLLTWDDWGGWDDHVATPNVEQTADGVQVAYGPRVPLLMFGGAVPHVIDSRWCSHVSVPKTALQLLGLPPLGVPRVDDDAGLADLVAPTASVPPPPAAGAPIALPPPPVPPRGPSPPPASSGHRQATPEVQLRDGSSLPAPNDVTIGR